MTVQVTEHRRNRVGCETIANLRNDIANLDGRLERD